MVPIDLDELQSKVARELQECTEEERQLFDRIRMTPSKWQLSPWGNESGGFWAIGISGHLVLWFNDIQEGFNVSVFEIHGEIPATEYWYNQNRLSSALSQLERLAGRRRVPMDLH